MLIAGFHNFQLMAFILHISAVVEIDSSKVANSTFTTPIMLKSKKKIISLVDNQTITLINTYKAGKGNSGEKIPLDKFINDPDDILPIPLSTENYINSLLIVPDYWFGNFTYKFQSPKKSLANLFVKRKLRNEFANQPDIENFSDCIFYLREPKEQWLYAYYLHEPIFFQLYEKLRSLKLPPHRITCPALLWKYRLQNEVAQFEKGGKCLIQLLPEICFLYFFFEGNFIFSRTITLTDLQVETSGNLEAVNYELNQSLYLFSQQTKTEIEDFFIISSGIEKPKEISGILGKDLQDLNYLKARLKDRVGYVDNFSEPSKDIITTDLLFQKDFPSLTHRKLKSELDWKPIQLAGIVMGLLVLVLLSLESVFLFRIHHRIQSQNRNTGHSQTTTDHQKIEQYNEALSVLLNEAEQPSLPDAVVKIARSLPHSIYLKELELDADLNRVIHIKCFMKSLGSDHLKISLANLVSKLNKNFDLNQAMRLQDVDFEFDQLNQRYSIEFSLEL